VLVVEQAGYVSEEVGHDFQIQFHDMPKVTRDEIILPDEVLKVVGREAKKRREAATAFRDGGRPDRAERELAEEEVLARYLPTQLSDDELATLVQQAVAETGASGPQAMGAVMKALGPRVAGRAEGGRVAAAVRAALTG